MEGGISVRSGVATPIKSTDHALQETRCFDCLAELYGMLNEDDVLFGLWKRRGAAAETRAALSCIQHGMLVRGQDFLEEAINKNQAGAYNSPGGTAPGHT